MSAPLNPSRTRRHKWLRGIEPVESMDALFAEASKHAGRRYVSTAYKNYDPRVICSWQFATVASMIRDRGLAWADLNPKWQPRESGPGRCALQIYGAPPALEMPF